MKSSFHIVAAACFLAFTTASAQQVPQQQKTTTPTTVKKKAQPQYVVQPKATPMAQPAPVAPPQTEQQQQAEEYRNPKAKISSHTPLDVNERDFTDLVYIPAPGKFVIIAGLDGSSQNSDAYQLGTKIAKIKVTGGDFNFGTQVGVFRNVSLSALFSLAQVKSSVEYQDNFTSNTETKSSGWKNPDLAVQFRPMTTEYTGLFDIILEGFYRPDFIKSKSATVTDDGTMGAGRPVYGLNTALYRKWGVVEGSVILGYTFSGQSDSEDATTGTTDTTNNGAIWDVTTQLQAKVTSFLYGNVGVTFESMAASDTTYSNGTKSSVDKQSAMGLFVGGRLVFIPEVSQLKGAIGFNANRDFSRTSPGNVVTDIKDGSGMTASLTYMHQF